MKFQWNPFGPPFLLVGFCAITKPMLQKTRSWTVSGLEEPLPLGLTQKEEK